MQADLQYTGVYDSFGKDVNKHMRDKFKKLVLLACTTKSEGKFFYFCSGADKDDKIKMMKHVLSVQSEMTADDVKASVLLPGMAKRMEQFIKMM